METVKLDEIDAAKTPYQPNSEVLQLIETVQSENQRLHIELGNFASEKESLKQELAEVRSQLETERANRERIGAQLSELKKNFAPGTTLSEKSTPDARTILSQLARKTQKIPGVTCRH
jgi:cell division septum initiation protein DivIVA